MLTINEDDELPEGTRLSRIKGDGTIDCFMDGDEECLELDAEREEASKNLEESVQKGQRRMSILKENSITNQLNDLARGLELLEKKADKIKLTEEEEADLAGIKVRREKIREIRS